MEDDAGFGGMRLAGFGARFRADDILGPRERQQIALFGGVQEIRSGDRPRHARIAAQADGFDVVAIDGGGHGLMLQEQRKRSSAGVGREHRFEYGERHFGFMRQF